MYLPRPFPLRSQVWSRLRVPYQSSVLETKTFVRCSFVQTSSYPGTKKGNEINTANMVISDKQ